MENNRQFSTKFWKKAYESLSPAAQRRHVFHLQAAERWELALDAYIQLWSRIAAALTRSNEQSLASPSALIRKPPPPPPLA